METPTTIRIDILFHVASISTDSSSTTPSCPILHLYIPEKGSELINNTIEFAQTDRSFTLGSETSSTTVISGRIQLPNSNECAKLQSVDLDIRVRNVNSESKKYYY